MAWNEDTRFDEPPFASAEYDEDKVYTGGTAFAATDLPTVQTITTKIPPSYDGKTSWFAYEELVDDWCDITELDAEKRGPALRKRLEGEATVYKPLLDRDLLRDARTGVEYFKTQMRPHFVKGNQSVFLWRFFQLFRANRGNKDFLRWLGRLMVIFKRLKDSWMDLLDFTPSTIEDVRNDANVAAEINRIVLARRAAVGAQADGLAAPAALTEDDILMALEVLNRERKDEALRAHLMSFPLSDNLLALILTVLADLSEQQRERFAATMAQRGRRVERYTVELVREAFIELFCAPRSSLENPSLRTSADTGRSFCIIDEGDLEGTSGYWVEDDDTGEVGFLPEFDDTFWLFDPMHDTWFSRPFKGRRMRRGMPKGKGKGKGSKGRSRFRSRKGKSKGRKSYWQDDPGYAEWTKGKKGKKGKGKGKPMQKDANAGKSNPSSGKGSGFTR